MSLSLEHVDVCLPISGLKALVLNDGSRLILQGQGPYSRLIDERSGKLLAELRTFKRNNVHGFLILRRNAQVEWKEEYVQVICWGGQSLRVIDLVCSNSKDGNEASFSAASAEYLAPDWILSGCVSDSVDGEGSGGRAFLVTAHNALLGLDVMDVKSPKYGKGVYLQQLATGVKSILYSADTVALSPTHILIAAGTVFGEIIVWSCFLDENGPSNALSSIHHFFTGHEGSIFGIRISPEIPALHSCDSSGWLLASCSDDRTVRIWDISDCGRARRQDTPAYSTDGFELRSTGFGAVPASDSLGSESCLAKAFGHMARIWGVYFFPTKIENGQNRLRLASRGEDATCLIWDLSWEKSHQSLARNFQLRQTSSFHHHTGKHIWSLDMVSDDADTVIYTGGADGALKILRINGNKKETFRTGEFACKEDSLTAKSTHVRTDNKLKAFSFVARDCFLAISVGGAIQLGWIASEMTRIERGMKPHVTWETLCVEEDLRSFSVVSSLPEKGLALLGNAQGLIRLYDHKSKSLSTIVKTEQRPLGLYALQPESDTSSSSDLSDTLSFVTSYAVADTANLFTVKEWESSEPHISQLTLTLPPTFNNVTCASFICGDQYLALGSALGALAIYRLLDLRQSLQPLITIRRMHGKAGVNEVIPMSSTPYDRGTSSLGYFLTCGRDGDYCVHEMKATNDPEKPVSLETVHRSSASPCQNVVGVYFDKISHDLMLYGFRSSEFVLWNESTQSEVVSIECGGTRRSWAFHPSDDTANSGLFLWNKTSDFNALCIQPSSHRALRAGGHGREIKSMAVYNAVNKGRSTLFATGAEDTTVRIFAPADSNTEGPWGAFKCLRVLNNHGAGLQQVSWSTDGEHLFTSAGYGEFFVWRVRSIPRFGVAAVLMASSPKDDPKSDLRVTSFDVLDVEGQGGNPDHRGFLICLTFSNSTIEVFHYSTTSGHFILLAKGRYTSNCLTQARFLLKGSSLNLITAATDGYFTLWNLTSVLEPFYRIPSSSSSSVLSAKQPLEAITVTPEIISCENRYQIHSNSIKSLELVQVSDAVSLVIAGGDDNALTISVLHSNSTSPEIESGPETPMRVTTISIPDAHASAITTIKLLRQQQQTETEKPEIMIASSGNDHRVKIWSIRVDLEKNGAAEGVDVQMVLDRYSPVADISSVDVIGESLGKSKLLVCGVGMEQICI